jgi:ABC-type uncharacterized transport system auxiliary subunit
MTEGRFSTDVIIIERKNDPHMQFKISVNNTGAHGNILYSNKIINATEQRIRTDEQNGKDNNITKDDNVAIILILQADNQAINTLD